MIKTISFTAVHGDTEYHGTLTARPSMKVGGPAPAPVVAPRMTLWDWSPGNWADIDTIAQDLALFSEYGVDIQAFQADNHIEAASTVPGIVRLMQAAAPVGVAVDMRFTTGPGSNRTLVLSEANFLRLAKACKEHGHFPRVMVADSERPQPPEHYGGYWLPPSVVRNALPERFDVERHAGPCSKHNTPRLWFRVSGGVTGATRRHLAAVAYWVRLEDCFQEEFQLDNPIFCGAQRWNRATGDPETIANIARCLATGIISTSREVQGLHWGETQLQREGYGRHYLVKEIRAAYEDVAETLSRFGGLNERLPAKRVVIRDPYSRMPAAQLYAMQDMLARHEKPYDVISPMWYADAEGLAMRLADYEEVVVERWTEDLEERWQTGYGYSVAEAVRQLDAPTLIAPMRDKHERYVEAYGLVELPPGRIAERHPTFGFDHGWPDYERNMERISQAARDVPWACWQYEQGRLVVGRDDGMIVGLKDQA